MRYYYYKQELLEIDRWPKTSLWNNVDQCIQLNINLVVDSRREQWQAISEFGGRYPTCIPRKTLGSKNFRAEASTG